MEGNKGHLYIMCGRRLHDDDFFKILPMSRDAAPWRNASICEATIAVSVFTGITHQLGEGDLCRHGTPPCRSPPRDPSWWLPPAPSAWSLQHHRKYITPVLQLHRQHITLVPQHSTTIRHPGPSQYHRQYVTPVLQHHKHVIITCWPQMRLRVTRYPRRDCYPNMISSLGEPVELSSKCVHGKWTAADCAVGCLCGEDSPISVKWVRR